MAKVKTHSSIAQLRGAIGGWVFKLINGELYATQRPARKRKGWKGKATGTPKQVAWRTNFHHATRFAKAVKENPTSLAYYRDLAKKHGKRLRDICVSDYFSRPKIEAVDLSKYSGKPGSKIRFKAYETYPLAEVTVTVQGQNDIYEKGAATSRGKTWTYTATQTIPPGKVTIHLYAADHANQGVGHSTEWHSKR